MNETVAFSVLRLLLPALSELGKAALQRNPNINPLERLPYILNGVSIREQVEKAKGILDKGEGLDLERLKNLAIKQTEGEMYGDIVKYIYNHNIEGNRKWDDLAKPLDELVKTLTGIISELSKDLSEKKKDKHPESQSSGPEEEDKMPPHNVRRCLLYLSRFPKNYVFNRQRISRLLVAHEFIAADSGEPPLQHLVNWLEPVESSWDGDGTPNHFLIGNNVEKFTPKWPEDHYLVREAIAESIESNENKIFRSSLIFLGKRNYTLELNKGQFLFLKVLSLRNGTLKNENCLGTLSLLKYLDLKDTNVGECSWLKDLEELEMLDLRGTGVQKIPKNCLEKLVKLQHLLLGYRPNGDDNWLAGAELNTTELTTKLKTLRAIRWSDKINVSLEIADLSVTGLKTGDLKETGDGKSFWNVVEQFENLTRLGVAVTNGSVIGLEDCPAKLKGKLKRLRMEGSHSGLEKLERLRMEGLHLGLEKLREFKNLGDLTVASHQRINTVGIPNIKKLFCLRLYGFRKEKTLTLSVQGCDDLKKLVIGDMAEVETVKIVSDAETVDTFKLCNLPKLSALIYHDSPLLLRRRESEAVPPPGKSVQKSIFLRGFENIQFHKRGGLKIYHYDMNKQCYQEVHAI